MSLVALFRKKTNRYLFTTPSHDRKFCIFHKFYQWYRCDISEVDTFNPQEALEMAEKKAALIYGTKITKFLTNGSTSGIIASVLATCKQNDKILVWNNAHPCHKNAADLAGAEIVYYTLPFNNEWGINTAIQPDELSKLLDEHKPKAVIITSPTYEGIVSDIPTISSICKKKGVFLIVDEAHGALYPFSDNLPTSAVKFADFTIQSLHKTAGGINPTALLHCNCSINVDNALSKIMTTSPSYPMLATIEANINYLNSTKGRKHLENLITQIKEIKKEFSNISCFGDDIMKLLIKKENISGEELSTLLYNKFNIEDEKTNNKSVLLLCGIGTTEKKLNHLKKVITKLNKI